MSKIPELWPVMAAASALKYVYVLLIVTLLILAGFTATMLSVAKRATGNTSRLRSAQVSIATVCIFGTLHGTSCWREYVAGLVLIYRPRHCHTTE